MDLLYKIKEDLPNFREEIIISWLLPLAEDEDRGWPPTQRNDWQYILLNRSCDYWRELFWQKKKFDLNEIKFTPEFEKMIDTMSQEYKEGIDSHGNSPKRINSVLEYLKQNKKLPVPPILLYSPTINEDRFEIADGNHRLTALRLYNQNYSPITTTLEVWVGKLRNKQKEYHCIDEEEFFWVPSNFQEISDEV